MNASPDLRTLDRCELDTIAGGLTPLQLNFNIDLGIPLDPLGDERRRLVAKLKDMNRSLPGNPLPLPQPLP